MADTSTHGTVEDYYTTLGVKQDATTQDIKRAFRKIARECHPDVAGDNPTSAERFKRARRAYEVLVDPVERSRYDRRRQPRGNPFDGAWWGYHGPDPNADASAGFHATSRPGNELDLEDIFNDFCVFDDFGFGQGSRQTPPPRRAPAGPGPQHGPMPSPPHSDRPHPRSPEQPRPAGPRPSQAGQDVCMQVTIPGDVAEKGGMVFLRYQRLVRGEDGASLESREELHDLRVPPGTQHGDTLRDPRMGHQSLNAPPGELVCDVRVAGRTAGSKTPKPRHSSASGSSPSTPGSQPSGSESDPLPLPVSVSEALLGGRVEVATPTGAVRLIVPPCTSSGALFRLKGRNSSPDGTACDLYLKVRVVMPESLDSRSREIVLEFARLNPYDPRS